MKWAATRKLGLRSPQWNGKEMEGQALTVNECGRRKAAAVAVPAAAVAVVATVAAAAAVVVAAATVVAAAVVDAINRPANRSDQNDGVEPRGSSLT